jgi:type IV pilus assembly protein PilY1
MSRLEKIMRGLVLGAPFVLISGLSLIGLHAQTSPAGTPVGKISAESMADFEAYPSGVNALGGPAVPPLIMLVMSRDEQLFNKAYPDYTDLNGDGIVDTTYQNAFDYNGYFDPVLCYEYSGGVYSASGTASNHQCTKKQWSGNFLNWVSMSRMDIIRWVLYGGTRSTDTAANTVLERAEIPDDLHAWAKVYSGTDINKYTPYSGTETFCNVSGGSTGSWSSATTTTSGIGSTPQIRAASGDWADWATTAKLQCQWRGGGEGDSNRPVSTGNDIYNARVQVCQNATGKPNEAYCVVTGTSLKPEGLLQKYSTSDKNTQKRFGLVTGSWTNPRKGGQLRRNIGQLNFNNPGTSCATGDEFSSTDGTFCYKSAAKAPSEGVVMTLDRLQIIGWNGSDYGHTSGIDCDAPDHAQPWGARGYDLQANPAKCPDFGNPLAGMYAEALRYIQGSSAATYSETSVLPTPTWVDPYGTVKSKPRNESCAACAIVVISSGLNSFDDANVPTVSGLDASALTNSVQTKEGLSGNYLLSTYFNGTVVPLAPLPGTLTAPATNFSDMALCTPATIGLLATSTGICLGTPGQEGSYLISGLSYGAWTKPVRTSNVDKNFRVKTYGISLSDNLPSFSIPVGTSSISLSPTCRADPRGVGTLASCYIGSVSLGARMNQPKGNSAPNTTYGLTPTTAYPNVGSYYLVWEDSQYGSDHDQDATNVITYCVGASCSMPSTVVSGGVAICDPLVVSKVASSSTQGNACNANGTLKSAVGANQVIVRNQWIGFSSGTMNLGYQLSGTTADAVTELSNAGVSFGCNMLADIVCSSSPQVNSFTLGSGTAVTTLQTPLWYAARYSGYAGASPPPLRPGQDPSNYFFARNAGDLKNQLDSVFQAITSSTANNFGNATTPSSSNDVQGNGLAYQVQYFQQVLGVNWVGSLQSLWSDSNGFQREGTTSASTQVLASSAGYVTIGPDKSAGALANAQTRYRCSVAPVAASDGTPFDPSVSSNCSAVSDANPIVPVWDAGTLLNAFYDPTAAAGTADAKAIANLRKQRAYAADASATANIGQRYIFTYVTNSPNGAGSTGTDTAGTQTDFVWNTDWKDPSSCPKTDVTLAGSSGFWGCYDAVKKIRTGNFSRLNEKDPALAQKLVDWVRGVEDPADYRSRTNNKPTVGLGKKTYLLGDIVDSSPTIVGTPAESYDLLYSDFTYSAFRATYRNRRQMVYVGANDGMLHAFNGGFYVPAQPASGTGPAVDPTAYRQLPVGLTTGDGSATSGNNWALGQEVWAFVPENLLPHLRWLADKKYSHVFYVDGSPVVTDAQIFTSAKITGTSAACKSGKPVAKEDIDAAGHVCGWGTVMVVPFRLGGGPISVNLSQDGYDTAQKANIQASNSAYVLMDVTNPEQPPVVLGEITTGTFTTSSPAFSVHREQSDQSLHFLLTIGSGPADNGGPNNGPKPVAAPTGSNLSVSVYDLGKLAANQVATAPAAIASEVTLTTGPSKSFAGDMLASDFNLNDSAEGVYFGVVTNPATGSPTPAFGGGLWKLDMNGGPATNADKSANLPDSSDPSSWKLVKVIDAGQPVTIRPTVGVDATGRPMVYFGTGRSFTLDDDSGKTLQGAQQQYIYGVSDNSLQLGLDSTCQKTPTVSTLFGASDVSVKADGSVTGVPTALSTVTSLTGLEQALTAIDPSTTCYAYSGWRLPLAAGSIAGAADGSGSEKPSERVVSSQTLLGGILLTPTYVPPSKADIAASGTTDCAPVPVPGKSNLYGLNYQTGTASPSLSGSFGTSSGAVNRSVSLGAGKASSPVLHTSNGKVSAAFGISGSTRLADIGTLSGAQNGEISWREPVDKR